ncbi:Rv2578c family radical SAM protein [Spongiactinospora sp. TRM90649]|uniref:Rv2578c family radical SAM protein n=1 Tax=Spongiactinospora sp. TRM90649 TaxID=3031114 RepID=UPI0023F7DC5A|nr:Rv2578c family radical SAM protein [Spongiactinospora sp. TRM90649]MDF5758019.1 Rv2578c family radical SAM protein [Spongiactinospora sp. TRM90649]
MRWDNLRPTGDGGSGAAAPLFARGAVARTFDTPGFRGTTFYEIRARSIINRVPAASHVPFEWTLNPYRGCTHACGYCFARNTHTYLDLDAGHDFDSKIVVKVNAAELLRAELAAPRWGGHPIAMGTNVDCYQRAEGRYELMRGILAALRDAANPFSVLTKGSLILRDLDLLTQAAEVTDVSTAVSVGFVGDGDGEAAALWRSIEPGTPAPARRLEVCAALTGAGLPCAVLMAPILPYLTDSPAALERTVRLIAESGATGVTPIVLHLRTGAREWFLSWLAREHPRLIPRYREMYGRGAYAPKSYQRRVTAQVAELARRYGVGRSAPARPHRQARRPSPATGEQLSLM